MEPPKLPSHNETLKAHGCPGNPIRKWLGMGWEVNNIDFLRLGMGWEVKNIDFLRLGMGWEIKNIEVPFHVQATSQHNWLLYIYIRLLHLFFPMKSLVRKA